MAEANLTRQVTINAYFFQEIKDDQVELSSLMSRLHELAVAPAVLVVHPREFCDKLIDLRDQLAFHFALEEAYGYFDDAIEAAPRLHSKAIHLRCEHSDLYQLACELAEHGADAVFEDQLLDAAREFLKFKMLFDRHEASERSLILAAIQDDIGGGD